MPCLTWFRFDMDKFTKESVILVRLKKNMTYLATLLVFQIYLLNIIMPAAQIMLFEGGYNISLCGLKIMHANKTKVDRNSI